MGRIFTLGLGLIAVLLIDHCQGKYQKIVGGDITPIEERPETVAVLFSWDLEYYEQFCVGVVLNNRSVLTAAFCFRYSFFLARWRVRAGSTSVLTGGTVHNVIQIIKHPLYDAVTSDSDIAIMRVNDFFIFNESVRPAAISGQNYVVPDGDVLYAAGWGALCEKGPSSTYLRQVQIWAVGQQNCWDMYGGLITDNMICASGLEVGLRDQCQGDYGGPLIHQGVVVGIYSWGDGCARPFVPSVNTRISRFTSWIIDNA